MHHYKCEWGEEKFLERYVILFHNQQGCKICFPTLRTFFLLPLKCRILFPYILVLHIFFPVYGLPPPPAPPHIANGAFLTSCSVQCITPRVCGGDITQSGCDHTTCTMVGQEPIWAPGWGYSKGTLSVQSLS